MIYFFNLFSDLKKKVNIVLAQLFTTTKPQSLLKTTLLFSSSQSAITIIYLVKNSNEGKIYSRIFPFSAYSYAEFNYLQHYNST